ncbi:hypothetical protein GJAV_G00006440 [Gymnothorax javanicus]|nr:hypothetical protein GJAV_G00006440 [Gymnothorax javanicus]
MIRLLVFFLPLSTSLPLLGWVESPGYPRGYPNEAKLEWKRCAPPGHALFLTFIHLDLEDSDECSSDEVKISSDEGTLASLCGRKSYEVLQSSINPSLQSSVSGCLMLSFRSDFSNTERHSGFRAFYSVQDVDECEDPDNACNQFCGNYIGGYRCACWQGYYMEKDEHTCRVNCSEDLSGLVLGKVSSPGRPGPYPGYALCSHTLAVEDELQVVLEFSEEFDIEEREGSQCVDSVTIKTPSREFGPFCGRVPPRSPLRTGSHQVEILFSSDETGSNTGFALSFKTAAKTCQNEVTSHSSISPQMSEYVKGETVTVSCDRGYFPVSDYKSVCLSTGVWSPVIPCEPVDCGSIDIPEDGIVHLVDPDHSTVYKTEVHFQCESKYYTLQPNEPYICGAMGDWKSKSGQTALPKCVPVCGKTEEQTVSYSRIFGGTPAKQGEIPWHLWLYSLAGSAALIDDRWALTAAHVVENHAGRRIGIYGGLVVRLGAYLIETGKKKIEDAIQDSPGLVVMEADKIIFHPDYKQGISKDDRLNFDNDIALIKLTSRAKLGPALLPVCLPDKKLRSMEGTAGTVSGWGRTEGNDWLRNKFLLHAGISGYSHTSCSEVPMNSNQKKMSYTDNMFCAGEKGKDSCQGDSGGPFVVPPLGSENATYRLYGIVSWGPECKDRGYYTKVENYVDWIKNTISTEDGEL